MDPIAPRTHASRSHQFKMRLTLNEATQLKSIAHQHELSQADFVRLLVFGRTSYCLPDASKLETIVRQLSEIGSNINQAQNAINEARNSAILNDQQFDAMYKAIAVARRLWIEPLDELRVELKKLKPIGLNDQIGDDLDATG